MDIRQITPEFFVAPQITPEEVKELAAAGITRIICNRPDIEIPPMLHAAEVEDAAKNAGVEFFELPLTHQTMTPDVIQRNWHLIESASGPVLSYCASGTRSTIAWALGAAQKISANDIIIAARNGGYDLSNLRPALEAAARIGGKDG